MNREEILALAIETSDLELGALAFLGALQDATTTLWKNSAKADQDDYVHEAKEWSVKSSPPHIQSRQVRVTTTLSCFLIIALNRMATSMRKWIIQDFQRQLYKPAAFTPLFSQHMKPTLPSTTMSGGYATKVVQSMLEEYCIAHIHECSDHLPICMLTILE